MKAVAVRVTPAHRALARVLVHELSRQTFATAPVAAHRPPEHPAQNRRTA